MPGESLMMQNRGFTLTDTATTFSAGEIGLRTWSNSIVRVDDMRVTNGTGSPMTIKSNF